jgi:hypothetical protein
MALPQSALLSLQGAALDRKYSTRVHGDRDRYLKQIKWDRDRYLKWAGADQAPMGFAQSYVGNVTRHQWASRSRTSATLHYVRVKKLIVYTQGKYYAVSRGVCSKHYPLSVRVGASPFDLVQNVDKTLQNVAMGLGFATYLRCCGLRLWSGWGRWEWNGFA